MVRAQHTVTFVQYISTLIFITQRFGHNCALKGGRRLSKNKDISMKKAWVGVFHTWYFLNISSLILFC